jgi:putative phage-type endonuclease
MAGRGSVSAFADHCEWTGASAEERETWLRARRAGIGGSDVAAVLGLSRWRSALALYVEKISDAAPDEISTEIADWGRIFEPVILRQYAARTKRRVIRGGKLMRSKTSPHHLITLDGVQFNRVPSGAKGPGVAEVKTTGYGERFQDDLPIEVQIQIQWEMVVTGASWATCIWLPFPERRMQWIDVMPHPVVQEQLVVAVDNFWQQHVLKRVPPDPDGSESSMLALRTLFPDEDPAEIIRIAGATSIADEYERNKAAIDLLMKRQGLIKNTLAATMRTAKYAVLDDGRYFGTALYPERENRCRHCSGVLSTTKSYKTYTLRAPKKKPLIITAGVRELVVDLTGQELERQLTESIVGPSVAANEPNEGAAE